jgi:hypothetical protein
MRFSSAPRRYPPARRGVAAASIWLCSIATLGPHIGPFSYQGRARDVVNASLGDPTVIAMNKERCMETHCSTDYKWTQRVRIVELEKEFS